MSYHVFSNLGAKLNADTASKLMAGIDDLTWITRPCNCGPSYKVDGKCIYGEKCRVACVVYKATCKCCNQSYIGKSQHYWKKRMQEHFRDVWKMLERINREPSSDPQDSSNSFGSDIFACHFSAHCSYLSNSRQVRKFSYENIKLEIVWKGSKISCNKSANSNKCSLCFQERRLISYHFNENILGVMN